ncbi:MAG: hypothetical protein LBC04_02435 [Holosporaceae bacterium]|nr:hypothetical protein [Holosporaceae bacterium]
MKYVFFKSFKYAFVVSFIFYMISNAVVFIDGWYPHTLSGFMECYWVAIPFFWNRLSWMVFLLDFLFRLLREVSVERSSDRIR